MAATSAVRAQDIVDQRTPWLIIGGLTLAIVLAYWNALMIVVDSWSTDQYSHGFLVPIFAVLLIAMLRQPFESVPASERWWGVMIVGGGLLMRVVAGHFHALTFDVVSFIPAVAGVFVIAGGWSAFRWAWAPVAFLVFMIPLTHDLEHRFLDPLQRIATLMSTYTLQTLGLDAFNTGSQIIIGGTFRLNVEEQCSGLRMATIFLALSVAMSMIINRPWWTKAIIVLSGIPIALIANVIRIVVTALLFRMLGPDAEFPKHFFHGLAGWFMMPIALAIMYFEMLILDRVFIEETQPLPQVAGFGPAPVVRRSTPTQVH
jgi:exosortase